jgi:mRNA interferase YafQ
MIHGSVQNGWTTTLGGEWAGHRECHIGGDFLLAYKLDDSHKPGLVVFVRAGTHADLFD